MWRLRKKNYRGGEMREIIDYTVICSDKLTALKERGYIESIIDKIF